MATDQLLEQIIEAVQKLDETRQREVLQHIQQMRPAEFDFDAWLTGADAIRNGMIERHGPGYVDILGMLDEIREEPTDERLGRR